MHSKVSPSSPGSFASIHQQASGDLNYRQGLQLPFRLNFNAPALMVMYSSRGEFVHEVRKDEEEETEGVLLQGGVTGTGSVQGGCVAQLSKRWSLNTTVLSSPPAKFSFSNSLRYDADRFVTTLDLNLDETRELMAVEDTTDTRLQGGISILHNIPLIKGLSAGASLKWKSYGMPRIALGARYEHIQPPNTKSRGKAFTFGVSGDSLGTGEASFNCTAFASKEDEISLSALYRVTRTKSLDKSKLFFGLGYTARILNVNAGFGCDGSLGGSVHLGPLGLGVYYSRKDGAKVSLDFGFAPGF